MSSVRIRIAAVLGLTVSLSFIGWQFASGSSAGSTVVESMHTLDRDKARDYLETKGLSSSLSVALQRARYGVRWVDETPTSSQTGGYLAQNPQQKFAAYFSSHGMHLVSNESADGWNVSLTL